MNNSNKPMQQGFTIVEIMIALTIGLFLTAGAAQIFVGTNNTNRTQENLSRMQENARFAMHFLTQDIRKIGFDGASCGRGKILDRAINRLDVSASEVAYQFNTREVSGEALYASLADALSGANGVGANEPDSISIRRIGAGSGIDVITDMALPTSNVEISASGAVRAGFKQGDIVLITDCNNSDIFQITNSNPEDGILEHSATSSETPGNETGQLNLYVAAPALNSARVYRLTSDLGLAARTYSIAIDGFDVPGLVLNDGGLNEQLVADIENMQILYGQRSGNDMFFVPAGTAGLDMNEVTSVRVSLLVRSPDDFIATQPQGYFFNGVDVSGAAIDDRRLRRVYTSTIAFRNRLN